MELLGEIADDEALFAGDRARVGALVTGDDAEETRFATAIATDEADLFPRVEGEGGAIENGVTPEGEGKLGRGKNGVGLDGGRRHGGCNTSTSGSHLKGVLTRSSKPPS